MAVWLIRAGRHGDYEPKFIKEKRVYVTWDCLNVDLSKLTDRNDLIDEMTTRYPDTKLKAIQNWARQIWPFAHEMKIDDLVILPSKLQPVIYVGKITSNYHSEPKADNPFFHWRSVEWIGEAIPRSNFSQDLLYSFGAFLTICRIQRNNAEQRIEAMRKNSWKPESITAASNATIPVTDEAVEISNLEELAQDQIAKVISAKFKGHNLTRLVEAILKAQGYITYKSPEGADGGADILAGSGPLGFGSPRLCVEVKSEANPIDRPPVDKLLGAMRKFNADQGLFVSWNGFKNKVQRDLASQFFCLRLWTQKELLEQLFEVYDRLDEDIKAELPLKRIWMVAAQDEEAQ